MEVADAHAEPKWLKPPLEWVKCNWDVAVDKDRQRMGVVMVVRDDSGSVVVAAIRYVLFITDKC
jgi:hypothetical protein